uniref:Galactosylgalactosylxylosylprotein 3-beta-glucuronosyltransferase n=1 Tax=Caenorhabditis japonica TaxID=281687 RepID=A0A8R1DJ36_CAEJA
MHSARAAISMAISRNFLFGGLLESQALQKGCEEDIEKHCRRLFGKPTMRTLNRLRKYGYYAVFSVFMFVMVFQFSEDFRKSTSPTFKIVSPNTTNQMIIVVTPTYKRITRIADMLRMANTLSHVKHLHWIVIEDANKTVPAVKELLERTNLPFTYMAHKTAVGYPRRGWYQRTMALKFIRSNTTQILGQDHDEGVVYFGDDDNSYDIRLFTDYIRNVKKLGLWAVGLVGGAVVEAPRVVDGKVTAFDVKWNPKRRFAVDMAGFAINLREVLKSEAVFGTSCKRGAGAPETCLLEDMGLEREDIEPFGYEPKTNREIFVWHTKTNTPNIGASKKNGSALPPDTYGYFVEV